MIEAERQFVDGLLRRIAADQEYTRSWRRLHADPDRDTSAVQPPRS
jgi:hypothetical protein